MDSFYGGKRGFSFILRPNNTVIKNSNGGWENKIYWETLADIENGIKNNLLSYGEYAVITETGPSYSSEHGKVYRVNRNNQAELVGKIGNPAPLYGLTVSADEEGANTTTFQFLNDNLSKTAEGFTVYWKILEDEEGQPQSIGIGFDFPRPVFTVENTPSTLFLLQKDIEQLPAGITISPDYQQGSVHYKVDNVIPSSTYIGSEDERLSSSTDVEKLNLGDLWFEEFDAEAGIGTSQFTQDIKSRFQEVVSEPDNDSLVTFWSTNSITGASYIYDGNRGDLVPKWDVLHCNFYQEENDTSTTPIVNIQIPSNAVALQINFILNDEYETYSPYDRFQMLLDVNGKDILLQGRIGEKIILGARGMDPEDDYELYPIDPSEAEQPINIKSIDFYNTYYINQYRTASGVLQIARDTGYYIHDTFRRNVYDCDRPDEEGHIKNNANDIINAVLSYGLTWHLAIAEEG